MEPVKDHQGMKIIGIDNGYGNIKTANCCFPAGLTVHDAEPVFKDDLLVYDGRYYLIGTGHKEFKADKTGDDDYYILTLAAIARELNVYGLTDATVYLAVGLPLTWVSRQREDFKAYLTRNRELAFTFRGKAYWVEIAGVVLKVLAESHGDDKLLFLLEHPTQGEHGVLPPVPALHFQQGGVAQ